MKITPQLKAWLVENADASKSDLDEDLGTLAMVCLAKTTDASNYLSPAKFAELSVDEKVKVANEFSGKLDTIADGQAEVVKAISGLAAAISGKTEPEAAVATTEEPSDTAKLIAELIAKQTQGAETRFTRDGDGTTKTDATPDGDKEPSFLEKMLAQAGGDGAALEAAAKGGEVRVKGAHEQYADTKSAAVYPDERRLKCAHEFAGQRVFEQGFGGPVRYLDLPSDLDKACAGVWAKRELLRSDRSGQLRGTMTDHDKQLLLYMAHEKNFGGNITLQSDYECEVINRRLTQFEIKTLLDDATSGGLEIAPIVFDDQIILTPLLFGELFPKVSVTNLPRGRRVEGASMLNMTLASGGADDSDIPLFSTTSLVSAFDTNMHAAVGAIEIGLDFLSDTPINIGSIVTTQYGQVLQAWLDEQIAIGDGSTEPEGIMNASGTSSVSFGSVAATVGVYEQLFFGIAKAFKGNTEKGRIAFCGTEVSYRRARAIPVGTADARRVFGPDIGDYMFMLHPFALNEAMANTQQFYANLAHYRMYRRLGMTIKTETGGKDLSRRNKMLITARSRWGGQLELGGYAAVTTTAEA